MKAYTNISQSKKLAEILPIESADMCYPYDRHLDKMYGDIPYVMGYKRFNESTDIPCWSLAALLKILKDYQLFSNGLIVYIDNESYRIDSDNPVDACYEMIIKLNELNLL